MFSQKAITNDDSGEEEEDVSTSQGPIVANGQSLEDDLSFQSHHPTSPPQHGNALGLVPPQNEWQDDWVMSLPESGAVHHPPVPHASNPLQAPTAFKGTKTPPNPVASHTPPIAQEGKVSLPRPPSGQCEAPVADLADVISSLKCGLTTMEAAEQSLSRAEHYNNQPDKIANSHYTTTSNVTDTLPSENSASGSHSNTPQKVAPMERLADDSLDWQESNGDAPINIQLLETEPQELSMTARLDMSFRKLAQKYDTLVKVIMRSGQSGCIVGMWIGLALSSVPSFLFIWFFLMPEGLKADVEVQNGIMAAISFAILCAGVFGACGHVVTKRRPATWDFGKRLRQRHQGCIELVMADREVLRLLLALSSEERAAYLSKKDVRGLKEVYARTHLEAAENVVPTETTVKLVVNARIQAQGHKDHIWQNFGDCWW